MRSDAEDSVTALFAWNNGSQVSLTRKPGSTSYSSRPGTSGTTGQRREARKQQRQQQQQQRLLGSTTYTHGRRLMPSCAEITFIFVICMAQLLTFAGLAQALVPSRVINSSLTTDNDMTTDSGSVVDASAWYTAAYALAAGALMLPGHRLGDVLGHRRVFILGFLWFASWSTAAGFAVNVQQSGSPGSSGRASSSGTVFFCVARALQGVGPALVLPSGRAMLLQAYPAATSTSTYSGCRRDLVVLCLFGACAPLGLVVGAALASVLAMRTEWPWAFWSMGAVCFALACVGTVTLPPTAGGPTLTTATMSSAEKCRSAVHSTESLWTRLDAPGALLGVSALVLVGVAVNMAPTAGWRNPRVIAPLIVGVIMFVCFGYVESRVARHPLLPSRRCRAGNDNRPSNILVAFVAVSVAAAWGCLAVVLYYSLDLLETVRGWSPLRAAAAYVPVPLAGFAAVALVAWYLPRRPSVSCATPVIPLLAGAALAYVVAGVLLATAPAQRTYWADIFVAAIAVGLGMAVMSGPVATLILDRGDTRGSDAALIGPAGYWSFAVSLGLARSVEASLSVPGDLLAGYKGAVYFGVGLGGLAVSISLALVLVNFWRPSWRAPRMVKA